MEVQIRYFAAAREAAGRESESVAIADGSTIAALIATLCERHPDLRGPASSLRVALDERFAGADDRLHEGAVVALIPPVGGG